MSGSRVRHFSYNWPEVPCIDISSLIKDFNSPEAVEAARKFSLAAKEIGFVSIKNHGISRELINNAEAAAKLFFSQSLAEKNRFDNRSQSNLDTGYFPAKLDGKEGYDILHKGIYWQSDEPISETVLPSETDCPGFTKTMNQYCAEVTKLTKILLHAISRANKYSTNDNESAFDSIMDMHKSTLRLNYYPARSTAHTKGGDGELLNCPEHYDSGLITILSQDEVGGLQVQRPSDKAWIDVKPDPDTIVINTGRAMEIISNGESLATLHRVKFTKDRERVSIPWFVAPNYDAQIFPFNVPAENWKYEKIEYMQWWNTVIRKDFPEYAKRSEG